MTGANKFHHCVEYILKLILIMKDINHLMEISPSCKVLYIVQRDRSWYFQVSI